MLTAETTEGKQEKVRCHSGFRTFDEGCRLRRVGVGDIQAPMRLPLNERSELTMWSPLDIVCKPNQY